ncbi:MAG: putative nucleotidyltransferase with HDIG domain [Motiliproteus sp.]
MSLEKDNLFMIDSRVRQPESSHYLQHLTALSDTQEVTASEDIFNQFGVLLIAKGSPINRKAQARLNQHQLMKNIDQQVALKTTFSDQQLFQQSLLMFERSPEFWQLHQSNRFEDAFRHICLVGSVPLPLRQKLSVMAQQLPSLFEHSLFTGWACALIAHELGLKTKACREAYICGLLHDIGLLHLSPEVQTQIPLSEENWRALQSHVIIGQRCADDCGLPKAIGQGIFEHHERLDRTGYPGRKAPDQLGQLGQLVASTDLLHSLCTNELSHSERSMQDALPYLKIHSGSFSQPIHSAIMRLLSRGSTHATTSVSSIKEANLARVRDVNSRLKTLGAPLSELSQIARAGEQPECQKVETMMVSIMGILDESGLGDDLLSSWMMEDQDPAEPSNQSDLKDIDAMQYELLWLFKRLGWSLGQLAGSQGRPAGSALAAYHAQLTEQLEEAFTRYSPSIEL